MAIRSLGYIGVYSQKLTDWQEFACEVMGLEDVSEFDKELFDLGQEFDIDDDALLNVLSQIIAT